MDLFEHKASNVHALGFDFHKSGYYDDYPVDNEPNNFQLAQDPKFEEISIRIVDIRMIVFLRFPS